MEDSSRRVIESLPVLLVDLARVCGFRVKGAEEAAAVGSKIRSALHESFGDRSEELFEMKSAVHADTSSVAEELRRRTGASDGHASWAVVDYPAQMEGVSVVEAWAMLMTPSPSKAVEAVRTVLVATGRSLVWKRDMLDQLQVVAARERGVRELRRSEERHEELEGWRRRRREQLEKLIEARPMFERRRDMAQEKLTAAASSRANSSSSGNGKDTLVPMSDRVSAAVVQSLDAKLESIDDLIARLEIEEGEEGYGFVPSDDEHNHQDIEAYDHFRDDEVGNEEESSAEISANDDDDIALSLERSPGIKGALRASSIGSPVPTKKTPSTAQSNGNPVGTNTMVTGKVARRKGTKRSGRPGIVEQLKARGSSSQNEKGVIATGDGGAEEEKGETPPPMSLVDAVAAMILGRYPMDPRDSNQEHFEKIAAMHQHMKDAWMAEFGRLPPMASSS